MTKVKLKTGFIRVSDNYLNILWLRANNGGNNETNFFKFHCFRIMLQIKHKFGIIIFAFF